MFKFKKDENRKSRLTTKVMLLGLAALMLGLLLVACGESPVSGVPGASTTATAGPTSTTGQPTAGVPTTNQPATIIPTSTSVPAATATPVSTTAPVPTAIQTPQSAPVPTTQPAPTQEQPAYNPVIRFSAATLKIGDSLTVTGNGYPGKARLDILLSVPNVGLFGPYANPVVDSNGNFTATVKLASYPDGAPLPEGRIVIKVSTADGKYGASSPVTLIAPQAVYNPALGAAPQTKVKLGGGLTLNGSGYPANLTLKVVGGVQNPNEQYGSVKTDANGRFSLAIKLPKTGIVPGLYFIYASSEDYKYQAKVQLDVQPAASPVLEASSLEVRPGQELTLSGSGYPPDLVLDVNGGVQNPNEQYGNVKTDAQGSFQFKVKLPAQGLTQGIYFIYASSTDFVYQANVKLTING